MASRWPPVAAAAGALHRVQRLHLCAEVALSAKARVPPPGAIMVYYVAARRHRALLQNDTRLVWPAWWCTLRGCLAREWVRWWWSWRRCRRRPARTRHGVGGHRVRS